MTTPNVELDIQQELIPLMRFVGVSEGAKKAKSFALRAAGADLTVLLTGETGAGKDHLAKIIHELRYGETERPFVHIDCKALPETLLEDELFGHCRGAFTSATGEREGLLRKAQGGTIFMNEIGNMGPTLQAKLLHVLDGQPFRPVGSDREVRMSAKVIVATNADLMKMVKSGEFREDLYHRLNGLPFSLAPLRERRVDIPLLLSSVVNGNAKRFTPRAMEVLKNYRWPGNVREFANIVRRAVVMIDDIIDAPMLEDLIGIVPENLPPASSSTDVIFPELMPRWQELERTYLAELYRRYRGDRRKIAAVSGYSVKSIYNKVNAYQLAKE